MKKMFVIVFCPLFFFYCTCSVCAATSVIVYGSDIICNNGDTISIPVKIKNNNGIMGFKISVLFPNDIFSIESVEHGEITKNGMFADSITQKTTDKFDVVWSNTSAVKKNGTIFIATFNISDCAITGDYPISLSYSQDDTFDEEWNDVSLITEDIIVHVNGIEPKIDQRTIARILEILREFITKIKMLFSSLLING